jgi:hypothetical protein
MNQLWLKEMVTFLPLHSVCCTELVSNMHALRGAYPMHTFTAEFENILLKQAQQNNLAEHPAGKFASLPFCAHKAEADRLVLRFGALSVGTPIAKHRSL